MIEEYPEGTAESTLLEINEKDFTYECVLYKQHENTPPQHEITRFFITDDGGYHRIGYTRRFGELIPEEKSRLIQLFNESVSLVTLEEAKKISHGLSVIDKCQDSLDLGKAFQNWKVHNPSSLYNGISSASYLPPPYKGEYIREFLDVERIPNEWEVPLKGVVQKKKEYLKKSHQKTKFSTLKETPNEVIFQFTFSEAPLRIGGIIRCFLSNNKFYSLDYLRMPKHGLREDEVPKWVRRLEEIKEKP